MRSDAVAARLIGFGATLAVLFGAGLVAGQAIDPSRPTLGEGVTEHREAPHGDAGDHPGATTAGGR